MAPDIPPHVWITEVPPFGIHSLVKSPLHPRIYIPLDKVKLLISPVIIWGGAGNIPPKGDRQEDMIDQHKTAISMSQLSSCTSKHHIRPFLRLFSLATGAHGSRPSLSHQAEYFIIFCYRYNSIITYLDPKINK